LRSSWQLLVPAAEALPNKPVYCVAAETICSDFFWPEVSGCIQLDPSLKTTIPPPAGALSLYLAGQRTVYDGPGLIGGQQANFRLLAHGADLELDIARFGRVQFSASARSSRCELDAALEPRLHADFLLGPPLLLMLACARQYCLHASVIAHRGRAVAILGASGTGKSTAARELCRRQGWQRMADDVAPMIVSAGAVQVFGNFPQLKVAADPRWLHGPVELVGVLDLRLCTEHLAPRRMDTAALALKLVSVTMAARLFTPAMLSAHLRDLAQAAAMLEACSMDYSHSAAALDALEQAVARWL